MSVGGIGVYCLLGGVVCTYEDFCREFRNGDFRSGKDSVWKAILTDVHDMDLVLVGIVNK